MKKNKIIILFLGILLNPFFELCSMEQKNSLQTNPLNIYLKKQFDSEFTRYNILSPSIDFLIPSSQKISPSQETEIADALKKDVLFDLNSYYVSPKILTSNVLSDNYNLSFNTDDTLLTERSSFGITHFFDIPSGQLIRHRKFDNEPLVSLIIYYAIVQQWKSHHDGPPFTSLEIPIHPIAPSIFRMAAFSPDTKIVALAGENSQYDPWDKDNNGIWIFDTKTQKLIQKNIDLAWGKIWSLAFDHIGEHIAVGSSYPDIKILHRASNKIIYTLKDNGPTDNIAFHPHDNALLAATFMINAKNGNISNGIYLWNIPSEQPIQKITFSQAEIISALAFNHDGKMLAVGFKDHIKFLQRHDFPEKIQQEINTANLSQVLLWSAIIKQKNSEEQNKTPFLLHTPYMMPTIYNTTIFASLSQLAQKYLIENKLVKNS
ncbi:MAG: hypothetical protein WA432_03215 [Candidatus Babeliaceae bacterium]